MTEMSRRSMLSRGALLGGAFAFATPLTALAQNRAAGETFKAAGYGPARAAGPDLALPEGFSYRIISRVGDPMSDGNPVPDAFDGMAAYPGRNFTTVLIRNHEIRGAGTPGVVVPASKQYDDVYNAGNTKVVLDNQGNRTDEFAVLGGTTTNCAGGAMPWDSWIACEEATPDGEEPHGYCFEIPSSATGPVDPEPIKQAGRMVHEACAWFGNVLYLTEDRGDSCFYRYRPQQKIRRSGQLVDSSGPLEALRIVSRPGVDTGPGTANGFVPGRPLRVDWVEIDEPDPASGEESTRSQGQAKGAAQFRRTEGAWMGGDIVYFDCTSGGAGGFGQVWAYDTRGSTLTLIYESPSREELDQPDNVVEVPRTRDIFLCEDAGGDPLRVRGITRDGRIYEFAESISNDSEFCGACFDSKGRTLYLNQQSPGVTYAITGPWAQRDARTPADF